jgi:hypothetical protein
MERERELTFRETQAKTAQLKAETDNKKSNSEVETSKLITTAKCQKMNLESKLLQIEAASKLVMARIELQKAGASMADIDAILPLTM